MQSKTSQKEAWFEVLKWKEKRKELFSTRSFEMQIYTCRPKVCKIDRPFKLSPRKTSKYVSETIAGSTYVFSMFSGYEKCCFQKQNMFRLGGEGP